MRKGTPYRSIRCDCVKISHFWCEKHKAAHRKGDDGPACLLVGPFPTKRDAEEWAKEPA